MGVVNATLPFSNENVFATKKDMLGLIFVPGFFGLNVTVQKNFTAMLNLGIIPQQTHEFIGVENRDLCEINPLCLSVAVQGNAKMGFLKLGFGGGRACNSNPLSVRRLPFLLHLVCSPH